MGRRVRVPSWFWWVFAVGLVLAPGYVGPLLWGATTPATSASPTTVLPRMEPTPAGELGIWLDPEGRPYDVEVSFAKRKSELVEERLTTLVVPDGSLRIMDGNAIQVDPAYFADEATHVEFGETVELEVSMILHRLPSWDSVQGVRLQLSGTSVVESTGFEYAYGTDGGVGGITTQALIDRNLREPFIREDLGETLVADEDGVEGDDTIIFTNGYGDGGFPMSRGFDASGQMVAVMIWDTTYPWRLAVPDGAPPPDVTVREDQLQACIDGRRLIDHYGNCSADVV